MFLSDYDIYRTMKKGHITIDPFREGQLQVASYDVTLDNEFQVIDRYDIQASDPARGIYPRTRTIVIPEGEAFILHPGESVLGKQFEKIGVDLNHLMLLSGKSSLARIGLVVHNTAMLFNPGHTFYPTFELVNNSNVPIMLRPGMEIAQILFARLTSEASRSYEEIGRYNEQNSDHFVRKKARDEEQAMKKRNERLEEREVKRFTKDAGEDVPAEDYFTI